MKSRKQTTTMCHYMIKEVAQAIAHEQYAMLMKDNQVYKKWKEQCPELSPGLAEAEFVKHLWPKLLEQSRHTLAQMLTGPLDPVLKDQIAEALIADNTFLDKRKRMTVVGTATKH